MLCSNLLSILALAFLTVTAASPIPSELNNDVAHLARGEQGNSRPDTPPWRRTVEPITDASPGWRRAEGQLIEDGAPGWRRTVGQPIEDGAPGWRRAVGQPIENGAPGWRRTAEKPIEDGAPGWRREAGAPGW